MSWTLCLFHIVIGTKYHQPTISEEHCRDLYGYIYGYLKAKKAFVHRINGMPDHIHILVDLHPSTNISDLIRDLKLATNRFIKDHHDWYSMFSSWEKEYYASSESKAEQEVIKEYIINQKEHHKWISWREELLQMAAKDGIVIDERYL